MTIPPELSYILHQAGPALAAAVLAWAAYALVRLFRFESGAIKHLRNFRDENPPENSRAVLGERFSRALPFSLSQWENHLVWAQRGGHYAGQRLGNVIFTALLFTVAGVVMFLLRPIPVLALLPVMVFAFPFLTMRSKANKVRRKAIRALPEMAALVAAEFSAGTPADQAVLRAGDLPGPLSDLLNESVTFSRLSGQPLFSRKPVAGALVEVFSKTGLPALRAFALQIDEVANKGIDAPALMNDTARSLAREYREHVMTEKELLGGKLVRHVAFHFFMPAVIVILLAFFIPMIELMTR